MSAFASFGGFSLFISLFFFFFFDRFLLFEAAAALDCSRIHTHTHTWWVEVRVRARKAEVVVGRACVHVPVRAVRLVRVECRRVSQHGDVGRLETSHLFQHKKKNKKTKNLRSLQV